MNGQIMSGVAHAKALRVLLSVTLPCALIMYLWRSVLFPVTQLNMDLLCYYLAGLAVRRGLNLYDVEVLKSLAVPGTPVPPYLYPPTLAILLAPFTFLDYSVAKLVWIGLTHLLLVLSIVLAVTALGRQWSWPTLGIVAFLTLSFDPIALNFLWGQVNILTFLLLVAAFYLFKSGREGLAGASLGLATAIKISPALLILYFLWRRRWRVVGWAFGSLLIMAGLWAALVSTESLLAFANYTLPPLLRGTLYGVAAPANQSLAAFFRRLFTVNGFAEPLIVSEGLATLCTAGVSLLMLVASAAKLRGGDITRSKGVFDVEYSLVMVVALAVSTISWDHHFVWLLLPFLVLCHHFLTDHRVPWAALLVTGISYALVAVHYDYEWSYFSRGPLVLLMSPKLYGLILLWVVLLYLRAAYGREDESGHCIVAPKRDEASMNGGTQKKARNVT